MVMKFIRNCYLFLITIAVFQSCVNSWEFSPNQIFDNNSPKDLNKKNLELLSLDAVDDTITIAFVGDSQRFYDEVDKFTKKANSIDEIDFILLAGDISDFGLLQEFEWINEKLAKLNKPYLCVVGNHDLVANGEAVFERMFGPLNQSFIYDSVKFILHNTNSREYVGNNVPDLEWLANELQPDENVRYYIPVSHVPPFAAGDFNPALVQAYTSLFRNTEGLLLSLHGHVHKHRDYSPFQDSVRYLTSPSFDLRSFVLLKIANGTVTKSIVNY